MEYIQQWETHGFPGKFTNLTFPPAPQCLPQNTVEKGVWQAWYLSEATSQVDVGNIRYCQLRTGTIHKGWPTKMLNLVYLKWWSGVFATEISLGHDLLIQITVHECHQEPKFLWTFCLCRWGDMCRRRYSPLNKTYCWNNWSMEGRIKSIFGWYEGALIDRLLCGPIFMCWCLLITEHSWEGLTNNRCLEQLEPHIISWGNYTLHCLWDQQQLPDIVVWPPCLLTYQRSTLRWESCRDFFLNY